MVLSRYSLGTICLVSLCALATPLDQKQQEPFLLPDASNSAISGHAAHVPRIDYAALSAQTGLSGVHPLLQYDEEDFEDFEDALKPPMGKMELVKLHVSGKKKDRVNLMFLADGYTKDEKQKFIDDASKLTAVVVSQNEAMSHVADLLNIWGVFVPSKESGIGTHDTPIHGNPFGLYRPGPELRGVYVAKPSRARAVCNWWNKQHGEGGCDSAILLGNDGLYGGLGGEFTVITASELNGPLVLRHELGHTLIEEGDEYDGSFAYDGANAAKVHGIEKGIKWDKFLSDPDHLRIEDSTMPLQDYPWQNLTESPYQIPFTSTSTKDRQYPTAMIRTSISGLSAADQLAFTLNDQTVDLSSGFPDVDGWRGSRDRRWIEAHVTEEQIKDGENIIKVHLTDAGRQTSEPQGGKMITSVEVIQYGEAHRFNGTDGFVGAFPTFDDHKRMTLRPTNENCLMRRVQHKTFCPVCASALREKLEKRIKHRK